MRVLSLVLSFVAAADLIHANSTPRAVKPPYLFLVGDSTVAPIGGWGNGLLSYLKNPAGGENRAKGGSTAISWRADGRWEKLITGIESVKTDYEPIVTIQFGHNDQKSMNLNEFEKNLVGLATDIKKLGGTPIYISSLARRKFKNDAVVRDLKDWRDRTWAAAKATNTKFLDLNTASTAYLNAIGSQNAAGYNREADDVTHLNVAGQGVFGRMLLDLLLEKRTDLKLYFNSNKSLSDKIKNGEFSTG